MAIRKESIGLFVIGGLVLFGIGMFLIGDRHQLFARQTEYYTEFANLSGVTTGAKVRVSGLDAGEVLAIEVPDSPAARFRLRFRIDAQLRALVRSDSVVTIGREGSSAAPTCRFDRAAARRRKQPHWRPYRARNRLNCRRSSPALRGFSTMSRERCTASRRPYRT
jgi:hypothetical protein